MSLSLIQQARPETAIVLGSGLGAVAEAFGIEAELPYAEIPGLGGAAVPGHAGRFLLTRLRDKPVLFAQGRRHLYEGLSAHAVAAGIRFMHGLGVRRIVLTNAAGAINPALEVGGLMLIRDHLNLLGQSPLIGPQFHDMTAAYSEAWRQRFQEAAAALQLTLREGVYAAVLGPQYETPAEIQMLRVIGADAVGMSTVPEVIQARALGMEVAGISLLTNWAAGLQSGALNHAEVVSMGLRAGANLAALLNLAL
ncbi:MAG: purine-nucleoside phosphorylase [Prosthecobacter sp.]|nr:purine-nucleoside phosphorylase [Prosthecobacter sp.]